MTAKILMQNGQVLHRSNTDQISRWDSSQRWVRCSRTVYDQSLWKVRFPGPTKRVGRHRAREYHTIWSIWGWDKQSFLQLAEELEPMPEVGGHYIGADILLPRGDHIARGHVVAWSHDARGIVTGRAYAIPILNTRTCQVEYAGGELTYLTTNIIAELMYVQCNADGNEYLLLDSLVHHHKDNKAISLTKQQITIQGRPVTHKTTAGWQISYQWKDGSTSWEKLSKLKEFLLVQTAKFAAA